MNLEEAKKCYSIAKDAVNNNDFEKAEKFLLKSIKLQETAEAQVLLQRLDYLRKEAANLKK
jgi:hypothetical protein